MKKEGKGKERIKREVEGEKKEKKVKREGRR